MNGKLIRDPVHRSILLNELDTSIMDTPTFQRLRGIKQLGTVHFVFPGATHSRFEHALGTRHLAEIVANMLAKRGSEFERDDLPILYAASLLHDVAHTPFSHALDDLFQDGPSSHEKSAEDKIKGTEIGDVLTKAGIRPDEVLKTINGRRGFLSRILKSDIDVDRLDYLQRDAYYCGVAYGVIDDRILFELRNVDGKLAVTAKGVGPAESVLFARYEMYNLVYNHKTARIAAALLCRAVRIAIEAGALSVKELQCLKDETLLVALEEAGGKAQTLSRRVSDRNLLKQVYMETWDQIDEDRLQLLLKLRENRMEKERIEAEVASKVGVDPTLVVIDVPPIPILEEAQVEVLVNDRSLRDIKEVSPVAAALTESFKSSWSLAVYGPEDARKELTRQAAEVMRLS